MSEYQKRFIEAEVKELSEDEGLFVASVSSGKKDRLGDVIDPNGWELTNYKKNPVILWAHNQFEPPVARADKVWVEDNQLMIKGKFAPTPFAQELKELVQGNFLNALSVGFMPLEEPKGKGMGKRFEKQELLEVSWVNVPALASALVGARKMQLPLLVKALENLEKSLPMNACDLDKDAEDITEIKPFPNEHACRIENPDKYKRMRRNNCFRKSDGKCIDYIWGVKDDDTVEVQALRFPKDEWTEDSARGYCDEAGGSFEPASEESSFHKKELVENCIAKMEETIGVLRDLTSPSETIPSEAKGRVANKPDVAKENGELQLISAIDKAMEVLRHRVVSRLNKNK